MLLPSFVLSLLNFFFRFCNFNLVNFKKIIFKRSFKWDCPWCLGRRERNLSANQMKTFPCNTNILLVAYKHLILKLPSTTTQTESYKTPCGLLSASFCCLNKDKKCTKKCPQFATFTETPDFHWGTWLGDYGLPQFSWLKSGVKCYHLGPVRPSR